MRLPVILVQNPPAQAASYSEALVGHLIGRAGLDLTLVNRFDSISEDSTDRMTLDGITVPSAVLDWQSPETMLESLERIGFNGYRCPHQLDSTEISDQVSSPRRLFLFDLNQHTDVTAVVAELDRLRASLSVKTVSLGNLGASTRSPKPPATATKPGADDRPKPSQAVSEDPRPTASAPQSDANLDALIDELDQLDV